MCFLSDGVTRLHIPHRLTGKKMEVSYTSTEGQNISIILPIRIRYLSQNIKNNLDIKKITYMDSIKEKVLVTGADGFLYRVSPD